MKNQSLNIFLIPSWFPNQSNPTAGIFCIEQAKAYCKIFPTDQIDISFWCQEEFHLHPKNILQWPQFLFEKTKRPHKSQQIIENLTIRKQPTFSWSHKIKGLSFVIRACRKNFKKALEERKKIDLIHAHVSFPGGYIASQLSEEFKIPYLITEHMSPFPFPHLFSRNQLIPQMHQALTKSRKIICVGKEQENEINQLGYANTVVIPNLIDETLFKIPRKPANTSQLFKFVSIGNMNEQKGFDLLLKAIALNREKLKNCQFSIIGDGALLENMKKFSVKLKIGNMVNFLGRLSRDNVLKELNGSDAFVLTSRHESFGLVYAEAMFCGLPVISTRCGGPEEYINEKNGFLVEQNPQDISKALIKMRHAASHFDLEKIRSTVFKKFSRKIVCEKIKNQYLNII